MSRSLGTRNRLVRTAIESNTSHVTSNASPRASHTRYVVLAFLCLLAFLTYFDRICIASVEPDIERDLHLSKNQMGFILGAFWLAYGLLEIPAGSLGDRFGPRRTLSAIALLWSVFTALSGSAVGFASLLAYRVMFGAGEAGAYPNIATAQHNWFPPRAHARIGGFLWLVSRWGGALSYLIFPALLTALASPAFHRAVHAYGLRFLANTPAWRVGFWICGLAGLVWVLLFYPWFRDDPATKRSVNSAELELIHGARASGQAGHARFDAGTWGLLLTNRALWLISIAYMGTSFGWSFLVSWMNQFLLDTYGISYQAPLWRLPKMLPLFLGGAACLIGGAWSDAYVRRSGRARFGRVIFPIVGSFLAALSMACVPLTRTPGQAMGLVCLASLATDIGQAPAWAAIIGIGGEYVGTAFGFINMIANVGGNFLAPVLCPRISHHYGWGAMMEVYAAAFFLGTIMWLQVDPTRPLHRASDAGL